MKNIILAMLLLFIPSLQAEEYEFTGIHYMASFIDCDAEALRDLVNLEEAMKDGVDACGATLLDCAKYVFEPDAITMVMLLSESHASIHTYPECNSCYIDLFTCGDSCDYRKFEAVLCNYLKPLKIQKNIVVR